MKASIFKLFKIFLRPFNFLVHSKWERALKARLAGVSKKPLLPTLYSRKLQSTYVSRELCNLTRDNR